MPAQSKRPSPPARMAALLAAEKRRMLADGRELTVRDFEEAWAACWAVMVHERAWPHATVHRRAWRQVQARTKDEFRAAFLDAPTPFALAAGRLMSAADKCGEPLSSTQLSKALLAMIVLVELPENEVDTLDAASSAARQFMGLDQAQCGHEKANGDHCRRPAGWGVPDVYIGPCVEHRKPARPYRKSTRQEIAA